MLVLGINDTHDASACLIKNGKLLIAIAEERLSRVKNTGSLPIKSINYIIKNFNITPHDIDYVAVATKNITHLNAWNVVSEFSVQDWLKLNEEYYQKIKNNNSKKKIRKLFPKYRPSIKLGYPIEKIPFITSDEATAKQIKQLNNLRVSTICKILKIDKEKILFFDHHLCHALYGYFSNSKIKKNKETVIVTADSGGDGYYHTVSMIKNDKLKILKKSKTNFLGKVYEAVTILLQMNPTRHLYKVMGLAPYASEYHKKNVRKKLLNSVKVNGIDFKINKKISDHYSHFKNILKNNRFDGIAGGAQDFLEIRLIEWFRNIAKSTKIKDFVFSGGVANNVKANKLIAEQKFVKSLFVPPGPGDESLSIGACYSLLVKKFGLDVTKKTVKTLDNAYWGNNIDKKDRILFGKNQLINKNFLSFPDVRLKKTAKLLAKGEIVMFCVGKMEFGQRALGHRSILSNPSKISQVKKLNDKIKKRDFWMPFTPSILEEKINKYVINSKKIDNNFMTVCFDTTKLGRKHFAAAIHPYDYTIRPQAVNKKTCNKYYTLIKNFESLTGIGGLLNTSMNLHDKPIISSPQDIINEIISDKSVDINHIYVHDTLYVRKKT